MSSHIIFSLVSISTLSAQTVWLDQLDLSPATQGWGIPKKNRTVDDNIMTIAGKTFQRGFGTHAESSLFIRLDGKANSFTAQVGIDDEVKGRQPAVEFIVYGDGAKLWASGVMQEGDTARLCSVKLSGVKQLELRVTDAGNGGSDHADWADAKFEAAAWQVLLLFILSRVSPTFLPLSHRQNRRLIAQAFSVSARARRFSSGYLPPETGQ